MRYGVGCILCLFLIGCVGVGSKITSSNYEKITPGMTLSQVEDILGRGVSMSEAESLGTTVEIISWGSDKKIYITLFNDVVQAKSQAGLK